MQNLNVQSINPQQLIEILPTLVKVGRPAIVLGSPGIGKSQIVKKFAEDNDYGYTCRMLSQTSPGDLQIPYVEKETGVLRWAIADWLAELPTDKTHILFLDEFTSIMPDVRTSLYQIILDKKLGGFKIPDNVYILCAGNKATDGASAIDLDTAIADRLSIFNIVSDPQQWLKYAVKANYHPSVLQFIKQRPDMLDDPENYMDLVRRSPRSWQVVSDYMFATGGDPNSSHLIVSSRIGTENTAIFMNYLQEFFELPSVEDLLKASDAEIKRMVPNKVSGLYGLAYAMNSYLNATDPGTTKQKKAQAKLFLRMIEIFTVICSIKDTLNRDEILVMAVSLLLDTITDRGFAEAVVSDPAYPTIWSPIEDKVPDLTDFT